MKLLLTSLGLTNDKIASALAELTGKNPSDTKVAFIPTGAHCNRGDKGWLIDNMNRIKSYGYYVEIVELTALNRETIATILNDSDVIFIGGGNCFYLSYWMEQKGLFDLLPQLLGTKVIASLSAGSMAIASNYRLSSQALDRDEHISDEEYNNLGPKGESSARTLNLVDFVVKPHFNSAEHYEVRNEEYIRRVAYRAGKPVYALDDQSALKITDGNIEVVSEGNWLFIQ